MAIAHGDMIIPAGVFVQDAKVANLNAGTLIPAQGLVIGTYTGTAGGEVIFNSGLETTDYGADGYRKCTKSALASVVGQTAAWPGKSAAFSGVVIMQFQTELDNTGGAGTQEEVVLVQAQGFQYIQKPSNLTLGG